MIAPHPDVYFSVPFGMMFCNSYIKSILNTIGSYVLRLILIKRCFSSLRVQARSRQYPCFPSDLVVFRIYEKLIKRRLQLVSN